MQTSADLTEYLDALLQNRGFMLWVACVCALAVTAYRIAPGHFMRAFADASLKRERLHWSPRAEAIYKTVVLFLGPTAGAIGALFFPAFGCSSAERHDWTNAHVQELRTGGIATFCVIYGCLFIWIRRLAARYPLVLPDAHRHWTPRDRRIIHLQFAGATVSMLLFPWAVGLLNC